MNIYMIRNVLKIKQSDLAAAAGITVRALRAIESGEPNPKLTTYRQIIDALRRAADTESTPPDIVEFLAHPFGRWPDDDPDPRSGRRRGRGSRRPAGGKRGARGNEARASTEPHDSDAPAGHHSEPTTANAAGRDAWARAVKQWREGRIQGEADASNDGIHPGRHLDPAAPAVADGLEKRPTDRVPGSDDAGGKGSPGDREHDRDRSGGTAEDALQRALSALDFTRVDEPAWARAYYTYSGPKKNAFRRAVRDAIRDCPAFTGSRSDGAIVQRLKRAREAQGGTTARARTADDGRQRRIDDACHALATWVFDSALNNPHSKGAYSARRWMYRRTDIAAALDATESQWRAALGLGDHDDAPAIGTWERWLRERYGKADAYLEATEHYQQCHGCPADYAGQWVYVDATGVPFKVRGIDWATSNKNNKTTQWLHALTDLASAHTLLHWNPGKSEHEGWSEAMLQFLLKLGYAPQWVVADRISALFEPLANLQPGRQHGLSYGVLAWLACGVRPRLHAAGRPTGGAIVERHVGLTKNQIQKAAFGKYIKAAVAGKGRKRIRECDSQDEFFSLLEQAETQLNTAPLAVSRARPGLTGTETRADLWQHAESARWRAERALRPDAMMLLRHQILPQVKVVRVAGNELYYRTEGRAITAALDAPLPINARDAHALVIPGGALAADDDPDLMRVLVAEPTKGLPRFHLLTAHADRYTFFGRPERLQSDHPITVPQTTDDVHGARRLAAAKLATALKSGRSANHDGDDLDQLRGGAVG
jgi:DNA-binding XRE family transcriptional regulator